MVQIYFMTIKFISQEKQNEYRRDQVLTSITNGDERKLMIGRFNRERGKAKQELIGMAENHDE